jgi:integrase/recombinase XerD
LNEIHQSEGAEFIVNNPLATLTDQFLKERRYFKNITPSTLIWHEVAFKNYRATLDADALPTRATLQAFVIRQRDRGVRAVTCNTYIGAMNAFCVWLHAEGHAGERLKLPRLRVEKRILSVLDDAQMRALIGYKPRSLGQRRVHVAALLALDTGLRVSELLHLRLADVDFDNLILKVFGKGQKERLVPFSPELRKRLYRFEQFKEKKGIRTPCVFGGFGGTRWEKRNSST